MSQRNHLGINDTQMGSTTRKTEMTIIAGSLQGLVGYLVHFTQSAAEGVSHNYRVYSVLYVLSRRRICKRYLPVYPQGN